MVVRANLTPAIVHAIGAFWCLVCTLPVRAEQTADPLFDLSGGSEATRDDATAPPGFPLMLDQNATTSSPSPASSNGGVPAAGAPFGPPQFNSRGPLMRLLDEAGVGQPLRSAGVSVFGYVEGSYTYNATHTSFLESGERLNRDRLFDFEDNKARLNQLDLTAQRKVDIDALKWDIGFRVETIYGSDSRYLHANGLDFYGHNNIDPFAETQFTNDFYEFQFFPQNQFDLFQAYVDVTAPFGDGLRLRLGKFESFFCGAVDPNQNVFYSRTLLFSYSHPFTFTGALVTARVGDHLTLEGGFSRGWSQSIDDNNGAIDGIGRMTYAFDEKTSLSITGSTGPEDDRDNSNYTTFFESTLRYAYSDRLHFIVDCEYSWTPHQAFFLVTPTSTGVFADKVVENARYYGANATASLLLSAQITLNGRVEFFRDEEGSLSDTPGSVYEATIGLTVVPFPQDELGKNFKLRPEVRLDYGSPRRYGPLDNKHDQVTFAIDGIYSF